MRAEIQNIVTEIEKSLELLGQRLDVETCAYRLEEFDARVEDPNLWDDPDAAQKLMRERQNLVDSIGTYEGIKTDLNDNIEPRTSTLILPRPGWNFEQIRTVSLIGRVLSPDLLIKIKTFI